MSTKTQRQKILDYIAEHGSISSYEAKTLEITQQQARFHELIDMGLLVAGDYETSEHGARFKRYYLSGKEDRTD